MSQEPSMEAPQQPATQSAEVDKIAEALAVAAGEMSRVAKTGFNSYDKYQYATDADIAAAVRGPMASQGLALVPVSCDVEMGVAKTAKGGNQNVATLTRVFRLYHRSGQWISVEAIGVGMDRGDKAIPKAETACLKYLLKILFVLPVGGEDAEQDSPEAAVPGRAADRRPRRQAPGPQGAQPDGWFDDFEALREGEGVSQDAVASFIAAHFKVQHPASLSDEGRRALESWVSLGCPEDFDVTTATAAA